MVIKHVKIRSFMGYAGTIEFDMPKIAALVGTNGIGKTSVLNALRYVLTGEEPDGDIINHDAQECMVEITLIDPVDGADITFSRSKNRTKPSKFMIDGQKTTAAKLNEKLTDVTGIALDKIKVLSSADVVASMKPQEFSKFILDYIPEKISLSFIIDNLKKTNMEILNTLDANFPPENIEMADIDNFLDMLKSTRKELKARLSEKKSLYETKPKELAAPIEEVEEKLRLLQELLNKKEVLEVKNRAYENALENLKKHEEMLAGMKTEYEKITVSRPDMNILDSYNNEKDELISRIKNKDIEITGVNSALKQLEITLDALNKPICPISPLITCHTDKSIAKEEITESIEATKKGLVALKEDSEFIQKKYDELKAKIDEFNHKKSLYEKKIELAKRIKTLEDNKPVVPEKPENVIDKTDEASIKDEIENVKSIAKLNAGFAEGETLKANIEAISQTLDNIEYLIKEFGDKGSVRVAIVTKYTKVFEDILNERSMKVRSDISFSIVPDNGLRILMNTGKGMLPYENLSGGEKAYMLYMIMDMLNSLSGTQILFIDELSVMDKENFNFLLDLITRYQGDYDHIIFAAVNHIETVDAVKTHMIPMVELTKRESEEKTEEKIA